MFQPGSGDDPPEPPTSLLAAFLSCLGALARCICCIDPDVSGEGGQRLLSTQQEASSLGIEAAAASPPRLPMAVTARDDAPLLKGHGPSSSGPQPAASPPMPLPFFPAPPRRHKRLASDSSRHSGGGSPSGGSSPSGASPKAAAGGRGRREAAAKGSRASLAEDEDVCPTCLDPYSGDNPRVVTRCGHHFHLPCLYEWLERSETCPVCSNPMQFEEIM